MCRKEECLSGGKFARGITKLPRYPVIGQSSDEAIR